MTITALPARSFAGGTYERLLRTRGEQLVTDVARIAEASGRGLDVDGGDDDRTRLVIALTLLAAGVPLDVVAERGGPLRSALAVLGEYSGVERYLLVHGLRVEHFHALRERLGEGAEDCD